MVADVRVVFSVRIIALPLWQGLFAVCFLLFVAWFLCCKKRHSYILWTGSDTPLCLLCIRGMQQNARRRSSRILGCLFYGSLSTRDLRRKWGSAVSRDTSNVCVCVCVILCFVASSH